MIFPCDGRPIPGLPEHVVETIREQADEIRDRTGFSAWYSVVSGCVQYHPGDEPSAAPHQDVLVQQGSYMPIDVERTVQMIMRSANASLAYKERQVEKSKLLGKERTRATIKQATLDILPEARDRFKYLDRILEKRHSKRVFHVEHAIPKR